MKLIKGINRDDNPVNQPAGTWRDARNVLVDTASNLKVEEELLAFYNVGTAGLCGIIKLDKDFIVFTRELRGSYWLSVITRVSISHDGVTSEATEIIATRYFNFRQQSPIQGEYRYNYQNEVIIVWYADNDVPRILNIDDIGIQLDELTNEFISERDLVHTQLFPSSQVPTFNLLEVADAGGSLLSGVYQVSIQYKLIDDSYTNFHVMSNPVFVNSFSPGDDWYNIYADKPGTQTSKYIRIKVGNLDPRYTSIRVGIIYRNAGQISTYIGDEYNLETANEINISTLNNTIEVDITEFTVGTLDFIRIGTTTPIHNVLYNANVKTHEDLLFQKYANNIKVKPVYDTYVSLQEYPNSYKDELLLFDRKTLMPNEVYALYIRFIRTANGKSTKAFHIPGRLLNSYEIGSEAQTLNPDDLVQTFVKIYPDAQKFHFRDTSLYFDSIDQDYKIQMGAWQNNSEFYPGDDAYDSSAIGGEDLRGKAVRHHKMPSFYSLMNYAYKNNADPDSAATHAEKPIVFTSVESNIKYKAEFSRPVSPTAHSFFQNTSTNIGTIKDGNKLINSTSGTIEGSISYDITATPTIFVQAKIYLWKYDVGGGRVELDSAIGSPNGGLPVRMNGTQDLTLTPGESIWIEMGSKGTTPTLTRWQGGVQVYIDKLTDSNLSGRILGLKLTDIEIPEELIGQYSHFEILYAKRTEEDMSVIGQGVLTGRWQEDGGNAEDNSARFYSFDLMNNKLSLGISHISYMYKTDNISLDGASNKIYITREDGTAPTSTDGKQYSQEVYNINKSKYIPADFGHAEPYNGKREEFIAIYFDGVDSLNKPSIYVTEPTAHSMPDETGNSGGQTVVAVNSFKPDMYKSFMNKRLVRTGILIPIDEQSPIRSDYEIDNLYGFDTVFCNYGVTTAKNISGPTGDNGEIAPIDYYVNYFTALFSISNIGYRRKDDEKIEDYFYPKLSYVGEGSEGTMGASDVSTSLTDASAWKKAWAITGATSVIYVPETYDYHNDLNSLNDLEYIAIYNPEIETITQFTNRIHRSIPQGKETLINNWRIFKVNEYYDSVYEKGSIYNLDNNGRDLIIQHKSAMFVTAHLTELRFADGIASALGSSDIFANIPTEIVPTQSGYVGCQSKFASFRSKVGNLIIDREQGKIFLYYNNQIDEISKYGLERWFRKNLQYLYTSLEPDLRDIDNPYINTGFTAAYDDKYNRLIIVKRVYIEYPEETIDDSWALSYYPSIKAWVSFHDFIPSMIFNTRTGIFGFKVEDGNFVKLNSGKYSSNSISIDVVFNDPKTVDKNYLSILWNSIAETDNKDRIKDITFNKIVVYNYNRHSNIITLENYVYPNGNVRRTGGTWKFNEFRDMLKTKTVVTMDEFDISELQFETIPSKDIENDWMAQSKFIDDFIVVRFIFEPSVYDDPSFEGNMGLKINDVGVNSEQLQR